MFSSSIRFIAAMCTQFAILELIELGVRNADLLLKLYGLSLHLPQLLSLLACYFICKNKKEFLVFPLLSYAAATMNSEMDLVWEARFMLSLYWPCLLSLLLHRSIWGHAISIVCISGIMYSYPLSPIFSSVLALVFAARAVFFFDSLKRKALEILLGLATLASCVPAAIEVYTQTISAKGPPTIYMGLYVNGVLNWQVVSSLLVILLFTVEIFFNKRPALVVKIFFYALFATLTLIPFVLPEQLNPHYHYSDRLYHLFAALAVSFVMFWFYFKNKLSISNCSKQLLCAFLISQTIHSIGLTYQWNLFKNSFSNILEKEEPGFVRVRTFLPKLIETEVVIFDWDWTYPHYSIMLKRDKKISTIVHAPKIPGGKQWSSVEEIRNFRFPYLLKKFGYDFSAFFEAEAQKNG